MPPRYEPIKGRKNDYQGFSKPTTTGTMSISNVKRTKTKSITDSRDVSRIAARLSATLVMLRMDMEKEDCLKILESLELADNCFDPQVLVKIREYEERDKLEYWRQMLQLDN